MWLCASMNAVAYIEVREAVSGARNAFWRYFASALLRQQLLPMLEPEDSPCVKL